MKTVSDTQIRAKLRSIVARYRLDPQRMTVRITRGTMRFAGSLLLLGRPEERVSLAVVEAFEREAARLPGVEMLYFDLDNWRRMGTGEWVRVEPKERELVEAEAQKELAEVTESASASPQPGRVEEIPSLLPRVRPAAVGAGALGELFGPAA